MTAHARHLITAATLATALLAAGCGSTSSSATSATSGPTNAVTTTSSSMPTSPAPMATASTITIHNFMFGSPITVKAGATVTVTNADTTTHTLAADDGTFNTGNIFAGHSATFIAPKPGMYKFHCNIHANMHGLLTVTT